VERRRNVREESGMVGRKGKWWERKKREGDGRCYAPM